MNRNEIISTINQKVAVEFEVEESSIEPDAPIYETLDLDSISLIDLVGIIQSTYKIRLDKKDLEGIKTFDDLYTFIENHL